MANGNNRAWGRSLADFGILTPVEVDLLAACGVGGRVEIARELPEVAANNNSVRAAFLRFLALGGDELAPLHESGVMLRGAWVRGEFDLGETDVPRSLQCRQCHFDAPILLAGGRFGSTLVLDGSHVPGINGDGASITGSVFLREGFTATGEVRFLGAHIGRDFDCSNSYFGSNTDRALSADGAVIGGSVLLNLGFRCSGAVGFGGAQIGGNLDCERGSFEQGVIADGAVIKGDVRFGDAFSNGDEVRLVGAQIGGDLVCTGGTFAAKDGDALIADRATIAGSVFLRLGFKASGPVRMDGVSIGGDLVCDGGVFQPHSDHALSVRGAAIRGSVHLTSGFKATGTVLLIGARIEGNFSCERGTFECSTPFALAADRVAIKGSAFLRHFHARGEVRLVGAEIGGDLDCTGAKFKAESGFSLAADGATIKGAVFLRNGFEATCGVRLVGTRIGGNLECNAATLPSLPGEVALLAGGMCVTGTFFFHHLTAPASGVILVDATVGNLADDAGSWGENLALDHFKYGAFVRGAPTDAKTRLAWLQRQSTVHYLGDGSGKGFRPQPWRQLQRVLHDSGHAEEARQVAIALENHLRRAHIVGQPPAGRCARVLSSPGRHITRSVHWLFGVLTGYGYRPLRLLFYAFVVWIGCASIYWYAAAERAVFAPSNALVFQNKEYCGCRNDKGCAVCQTAGASCSKPGERNWYLCEHLPPEYTSFSPLAYSLDVILPLVDLQQEKDWAPLIPTPQHYWWTELRVLDCQHIVRLVIWAETIFGWVASLLLVAIVSGLAKRRDE